MENKPKIFDFSPNTIIKYIISKLKVLIIIAAIAATVTGIASIFMKNKYKAEVILFPAYNGSSSMVDPGYGGEVLSVGLDKENDQLMQTLNSVDLEFELIKKYKLAEHYKVNMTKEGAQTELLKMLEGNLSFKKTEYNTVEVKVVDEDPIIAANMANDISGFVDSLSNRMLQKKAIEAYRIIRNEHDSLSHQVHLILDSLTNIYKLGLIDNKEVAKAYLKALSAGKTELANVFEKKVKLTQAYGVKANLLNQDLSFKNGYLSSLSQKITIAKVALNRKITINYVVSKAIVPDKKDSPKRLILMFVSAISAFFLALMAFIILDNYKKLLQ